MTAQAVFAPSPKPEKNGKKLADVPEEDSHPEDNDETDDVAELVPTTKSDAAAVVVAECDKEAEASEVENHQAKSDLEETENVPECGTVNPQHDQIVADVAIETSSQDPLEETEASVEIQEQKSEL